MDLLSGAGCVLLRHAKEGLGSGAACETKISHTKVKMLTQVGMQGLMRVVV